MINAPSCSSRALSLVFAALLVAGVSLCAAAPGEAASSANYFLKIVGIPGDVPSETTKSHAGEIEVLSFTMNFSQSVPCGQLLITKYIDRASSELVRHMLIGSILPEALLTAETVQGGLVATRQLQQPQEDFFRLRLQQVKILTLAMQDNSGAPPAVEQVTLSASVIKVEFRPRSLTTGRLEDFTSQVINCTK